MNWTLTEVACLSNTMVTQQKFNYLHSHTTLKEMDYVSLIIIKRPSSAEVILAPDVTELPLEFAKAMFCVPLVYWTRSAMALGDFAGVNLADMELVDRAICAVSAAGTLCAVRRCSTNLLKLLRFYNRCNGKCGTPFPDKIVSSCILNFWDESVRNKFLAIGLVEVLNTMAYELRGGEDSGLFFDMNTICCGCDANIFYNKDMVKVQSTLRELKRICRHYIQSWCKANATNASDCRYLRKCVEAIDNATAIGEIAGATNLCAGDLNTWDKSLTYYANSAVSANAKSQ